MMKNSFLMLCAFICAACFVACSEDDPNASYEVTLQGVLEQVDCLDGTEEEDLPVKSLFAEKEKTTDLGIGEINYRDWIAEAFEQLEIVGEQSRIHEKATVNYNNISAAELLCFQQANNKIVKKLDPITFLQLKTLIFNNHAELLKKNGIFTVEDIPITQINVRIVYVTADPSKYLTFEREYKEAQ